MSYNILRRLLNDYKHGNIILWIIKVINRKCENLKRKKKWTDVVHNRQVIEEDAESLSDLWEQSNTTDISK